MHLKTDSASNAHFSRVPSISKPRNAFSIAKKHVTTMQFDKLFPLFWKYTMPGDTISGTFEMMGRLQTQIGPLYDDLYLDAHAWFVPFRLVQTDFARYQYNAKPGGPSQDNTALTTPRLNGFLGVEPEIGFASKSLYDYLGFPTRIVNTEMNSGAEHINNYLGRIYNFIWNEDYRDQNLQNPVKVDLDNGPDSYYDYNDLLPRGKRHDKFTSALPFRQKGSEVTLPLSGNAPVIMNPGFVGTPGKWRKATDWLPHNGVAAINNDAGANVSIAGVGTGVYDPNNTLIAEMNFVTGTSVNQLRNSIAIQHLFEADARGGTRDVEAIQNRWGVTVPDFRLQRPEYLGGCTFTFDGHIVPQTSASTEDGSPQATLAQFSQTMSSLSINHSFQEAGAMMILVSARSNITYQQGLKRELSYKTRFDMYQPEFANIGEVAIKNKEIFFSGTFATDQETFGFQEYGYELRYDDNMVTGEMRSNYPLSLDSRHMADDYANTPTLGPAWIASSTPISRNIAVSSEVADPIEISTFFRGKIARTMPMYSVPGLTRL